MNVPPLAAFLGFFGAIVLAGSVGRWAYAMAATLHERRTSSQSAGPAKSLIWILLPLVFLHSGPWALAIAGACTYYVLSQPHSPYLYWFFGGSVAGLLFMFMVIAWAMRRVRKAKASQPGIPPGGIPAKPRASIGDDTYEGYRLRLWGAFWSSIPVTLLLCAMWWQSIIQAPELLVVVAALCFVFSYLLGSWIVRIRFPKPWRVPPPK